MLICLGFVYICVPAICMGFPGGASGRDLDLIPGLEDPLEESVATHTRILA